MNSSLLWQFIDCTLSILLYGNICRALDWLKWQTRLVEWLTATGGWYQIVVLFFLFCALFSIAYITWNKLLSKHHLLCVPKLPTWLPILNKKGFLTSLVVHSFVKEISVFGCPRLQVCTLSTLDMDQLVVPIALRDYQPLVAPLQSPTPQARTTLALSSCFMYAKPFA